MTAGEYFEAVQAAYADAERRAGGPVERVFRVAGHPLRLRFAGPAMVSDATAAFDHLPSSGERAEFSVCLFDSASTGSELPPMPRSSGPHDVRGDIPELCDERFIVSYLRWNGVLGLLDRSRRRALFWIRAASDFPFNERGSPLLMSLQGWLAGHDLQLMHAGAVGGANGGVLLCGRGGAGKSTTAIACLVAGLSYVADDYCVLAARPRPVAHSLYNSGKLHCAGLHRFPELSIGAASRGGDDKALFFLHALYPERMATSVPIRALVLPVIHDGADCTLEPVPRVEALRAMVSSTIAQIPGANGGVLTAGAAFVRQLPCYQLRIGSDPTRIAARIEGLLRGGI